MVNYQEAKIYKIINDEMPGKVYYGSTCNTFAKRLNTHKNIRDCTSKVLFEYGKPQMILVEKYPCNDKMELKQRERFYIENNECVNKNIPSRTKNEYYQDNKEQISLKEKKYRQDNKEQISLKEKKYYQDNKEHIALKGKKYYQDNKEHITLKAKQKINCDCGGKYTYTHKSTHFKTKKHQSFIIS